MLWASPRLCSWKRQKDSSTPKPDQNAAFQGGEEEEEKREKSASLFSSLQSSLHSVVGCMTLPLAAFKCRSPKGIDFTMLSALHTRNPPFYWELPTLLAMTVHFFHNFDQDIEELWAKNFSQGWYTPAFVTWRSGEKTDAENIIRSKTKKY